MATGIFSWSQTASSNDTADSTINWAEGQLPSTVNNSARAMMAILAKWRDDMAGVQPSNVIQTTAGSANAQTLTTNGSIAALTNGWTVSFEVGAGLSNTAACTINVDGVGAKSINIASGTALVGGELAAGCTYTITYHTTADVWIMHSAGTPNFAAGTLMLFQQTSAPTGWTKQSTHNNKALRVVTGTASSGGSTAFTSIFTSRTIAQANLPSYNLTTSLTVGTGFSPQGNYVRASSTSSAASGSDLSGVPVSASTGVNAVLASSAVSGTVSSAGSGTAMDFAVQYVDLIIAAKN